MEPISEFDLEKAVGGTLTREAEEWVERNRATIISRAPFAMRGMADWALDQVKTNSVEYDIPSLQALIEHFTGIDTSDLK